MKANNDCWFEQRMIDEANLLTFAAHQAKTVFVSVETLNLIGDLYASNF